MYCPICKSKNTNFFVKKDIYVFYRCFDCRVIFLEQLPSVNKLHSYYSKKFEYKDGLLNEAIIRKRSRAILKQIKKIYPSAKTLCDVGSGYGFFLDEAKNKYEVTGIEPSKQLAHFADKNYHTSIYIGELKEYIRAQNKQFDVVTCIHVIEHVTDPKEFISLLLRLVAPKGILYIETPNSDSHLLYVEKEQYTFLLPPQHLWLFSQESIKALLPKKILIKHVHTYSYPEHFMGIVKRLIKGKKDVDNNIYKQTNTKIDNSSMSLKKRFSYLLLDQLLAPLFTGILNLYHKGSILELYINKNNDKSGL